MGLTAILVAVLLAPLSLGRTAWLQQDSEKSATQVPPASDENQNPASNQEPPAGEKESQAKPDQAPPAKEAEKPGAEKSKQSNTRKRRSRAHKAMPPPAEGEPRKIVVHRGGTSEPTAQIVPGITQEEAIRQRESAEQLLASADSRLKQLADHTLTPNQQDVVAQIRHYMNGARSALRESDTQRAHTLAQKAYLLSDDLLRH